MDFKQVDDLFDAIDQLPQGNLAERIGPWKQIQRDLSKIEKQLTDMEDITLKTDDVKVFSENISKDNSGINIQDSLVDIETAIDTIKKGGIRLSEMEDIYLKTLGKIQRCEQEVKNTNLTILKQEKGPNSLTEVSFE